MQYFVAVNVMSRDTRRDGDDRPARTSLRTQYLQAFNRDDADTIAEGINSMPSTFRSGPFELHRSAEVCTYVRAGNGRGVYLTMSDIEMIVSDYTKPSNGDRTKAA